MSYTYRYTGDMSTAFINLERPWEPSKGDLFESSVAIAHPLMELVAVIPDDEPESEPEPDDEDVPEEHDESPVTDDAEEN